MPLPAALLVPNGDEAMLSSAAVMAAEPPWAVGSCTRSLPSTGLYADPKSHSLTVYPGPSRMFPGFRSRWQTCRAQRGEKV